MKYFAFVLIWFMALSTVWAGEKPNVILIYGDDVGYGDVGFAGSKMIPTPNLDKLAAEGLVFTDGHCAASTCTPSRYAMLTGQYAWRKRGTSILKGDAKLCIDTKRFTLPALFKKAGYTTSVVGKWHLGLGNGDINWNSAVKPGPLEIGFDYSWLIPATGDRVPCVYLENHHVVNLDPNDPITVSYKKVLKGYPNGLEEPEAMTVYKGGRNHSKTVINGIGRIGYMSGGQSALWDDQTMADTLVTKATDFMKKNKDKPFFLFFSAHDIHVPRYPHPRFRGKSECSYRGDAMVQFDWCAGQIMKSLDQLGLAENTIVIFTSDNGPVLNDGYDDKAVPTAKGHKASGPYRGGKYSRYEGGTRVPFVIRWPGKVKAGHSKALVSQVDFLASFASMFDIDLPKGAGPDSENVISALLGKNAQGRTVFVEQGGGLAIRQGSWKFIPGKKSKKAKTSTGQLYNLDDDIAEQNNVIKEHPQIALQMSTKLGQIRQQKSE